MALSQQETAKFAEYLGLPLDERAMYRYGVSRHLNEICGGKPRIMVERCDVGGSPDDDRTWLFSLVTNYDIYRGVNVDEPLRKYREIVKKVFGPSSRKVLWWLEYTVNRTPGHWRVSIQYSVVVVGRRVLTRVHALVGLAQARVDR